jgi:hypothetical protein
MMLQIVCSVKVAGEDTDLDDAYRNFSLLREASRDANGADNAPNRFAMLTSYLTISRYSDVALRSFAYFPDYYHKLESDEYRTQRHYAGFALLSLVLGLPLATVAVLWCHDSGIVRLRAYRRRNWANKESRKPGEVFVPVRTQGSGPQQLATEPKPIVGLPQPDS